MFNKQRQHRQQQASASASATAATTTTNMKNILISAYGSRGDIQPYVAIGAALASKGYHVRVLTSPGPTHKSLVSDSNLTHVPWGADIDDMLQNNPKARKCMFDGDAMGFFDLLSSETGVHTPESCEQFYTEITGPNKPDLIISGTLSDYFGYYAAYQHGIPTVMAFFQSSMAGYDKNRAPFGLPTLPFGLHGVLLQHIAVAGEHKAWVNFDKTLSKLANHPPILDQILPLQRLWDAFLPTKPTPGSRDDPPPSIILPTYLCMSSLFKDIIYPYLSDTVKFVGAATMSKQSQLKTLVKRSSSFGTTGIQGQIDDFIDREPSRRPIYMGWGSMVSRSPEHMVLFAVEALMKSQQRGILLGGIACFDMDTLERAVADRRRSLKNASRRSAKYYDELLQYARDNILFVEKAPHEYLFPKVACTVHHGGAGTTAAALRAGVPTIITPVFLDQFDTAYAIDELHVGIGFAKQLQKTTSDDLGAAIRQVLSDPSFAKNAKEIGIHMRSPEEDGTKRMVEEVEMFWKEKVTTGVFQKDLDKVRTQVDEWSQEQRQRQQRKKRWIKSIAGCTVLVAITAVGVEYAR